MSDSENRKRKGIISMVIEHAQKNGAEKIYKNVKDTINKYYSDIELHEDVLHSIIDSYIYDFSVSFISDDLFMNTAFTFYSLVVTNNHIENKYDKLIEKYSNEIYDEHIIAAEKYLIKLIDNGIVKKIIDCLNNNPDNIFGIIYYYIAEIYENKDEAAKIINELELEKYMKNPQIKFDDETNKLMMKFTFEFINDILNASILKFKEIFKDTDAIDIINNELNELSNEIDDEEKLSFINIIKEALNNGKEVDINNLKNVDEMYEEIISSSEQEDDDMDIDDMDMDELDGLSELMGGDNDFMKNIMDSLNNSVKNISELLEYIDGLVKSDKKISHLHKNKIDSLCKNIDLIKEPNKLSNKIWSDVVSYDKGEISYEVLMSNINEYVVGVFMSDDTLTANKLMSNIAGESENKDIILEIIEELEREEKMMEELEREENEREENED